MQTFTDISKSFKVVWGTECLRSFKVPLEDTCCTHHGKNSLFAEESMASVTPSSELYPTQPVTLVLRSTGSLGSQLQAPLSPQPFPLVDPALHLDLTGLSFQITREHLFKILSFISMLTAWHPLLIQTRFPPALHLSGLFCLWLVTFMTVFRETMFWFCGFFDTYLLYPGCLLPLSFSAASPSFPNSMLSSLKFSLPSFL